MTTISQTELDVNGKAWGDAIPFLGEVDPAEYDANVDGAAYPGDIVQHLASKRTYQVLRVKQDGRLVLWAHGWPRIRNADPRRWRVLPRISLEVGA